MNNEGKEASMGCFQASCFSGQLVFQSLWETLGGSEEIISESPRPKALISHWLMAAPWHFWSVLCSVKKAPRQRISDACS